MLYFVNSHYTFTIVMFFVGQSVKPAIYKGSLSSSSS